MLRKTVDLLLQRGFVILLNLCNLGAWFGRLEIQQAGWGSRVLDALTRSIRAITMVTVWVVIALVEVGADTRLVARIEKKEPSAALAVQHRKLLDPRAVVVGGGQVPVARLWFRRVIPVRATGEHLKSGLSYRYISEGTLVGAVEFPQHFTDYRKNRVDPGIYTLRFAVQPQTGEHTDTSPHTEFLLLCRAEDDRTPGKIPIKELIERSRRVNQGRHPAVLLLWPHDRSEVGVRVLDKGNGVQAVTIGRSVAADDRKGLLSFAITVAGYWKQ